MTSVCVYCASSTKLDQAYFSAAEEERRMRNQHKDIWSVADSPVQALGIIANTPAWDTSIRKFAAI